MSLCVTEISCPPSLRSKLRFPFPQSFRYTPFRGKGNFPHLAVTGADTAVVVSLQVVTLVLLLLLVFGASLLHIGIIRDLGDGHIPP